MKAPVHRWKQRVTFADGRPPHWTFDGKPCWLASGVKDVNGNEIYEGDKVIFGELEQQGVIDFRDATFGIVFTRFGKENFSPLYALKDFVKIKVIGHVTEEDTP